MATFGDLLKGNTSSPATATPQLDFYHWLNTGELVPIGQNVNSQYSFGQILQNKAPGQTNYAGPGTGVNPGPTANPVTLGNVNPQTKQSLVPSTATGPGGIKAGSYAATSLTQDQRQWLWNYFGHTGQAPVGYGGETPQGAQPSQPAQPAKATPPPTPTPTAPAVQTNPAQDLIDLITKKYEGLMNEYNSKLSAFEKANPFVYDKVLADEVGKATQRLEPYYTQTLGDFLTGVEKRRTRSLEDEKTLLTELNTDVSDYTGREKINLAKALNNAREEGAASGMYSSGTQLANEGETIEQSQYNLGKYLTAADRKKQQAQLGTSRTLEDLSLEERIKKRDLEREKQAQIQSQALTETLNTEKQRALQQAEVVGAPPGANLYSYLSSAYAGLG